MIPRDLMSGEEMMPTRIVGPADELLASLTTAAKALVGVPSPRILVVVPATTLAELVESVVCVHGEYPPAHGLMVRFAQLELAPGVRVEVLSAEERPKIALSIAPPDC